MRCFIKLINMKTRLYLPILLSILTLQAGASRISPDPGPGPRMEKVSAMTDEQKKARLEEIKQRVEEIRNIDRSNLSRAERKELRKEMKVLKAEANAVNGIYLSVGAIIIIILLLILIL